MYLVLLGNSGCGKTTLGTELSDRLNVPLISSGDIARKFAESDANVDFALRHGAMAPEQAMRNEVRVQMENADIQHGGWILDGFPRSIAQLVCLLQWSAAMPCFFHIDLSTWHCLERLSIRGRLHDIPDAIEKRLHSYTEHTLPLIETLDAGGVLTHISGQISTTDQAEIIIEMATGAFQR